jgi:hypothetical protein
MFSFFYFYFVFLVQPKIELRAQHFPSKPSITRASLQPHELLVNRTECIHLAQKSKNLQEDLGNKEQLQVQVWLNAIKMSPQINNNLLNKKTSASLLPSNLPGIFCMTHLNQKCKKIGNSGKL